MAEIYLYSGGVTIVDDADLPLVIGYRWDVNKRGYVWSNIYKDGRQQSTLIHRLLMGVERCSKLEVDHRDGDPLNNRRGNLRVATHRQNGRNQRKQSKGRPCTSKYKGVHKRKDNGKYVANIKLEAGQKYLGQFDNEIDAAKAYDEAATKYFGEFANVNFKKEEA